MSLQKDAHASCWNDGQSVLPEYQFFVEKGESKCMQQADTQDNCVQLHLQLDSIRDCGEIVAETVQKMLETQPPPTEHSDIRSNSLCILVHNLSLSEVGPEACLLKSFVHRTQSLSSQLNAISVLM